MVLYAAVIIRKYEVRYVRSRVYRDCMHADNPPLDPAGADNLIANAQALSILASQLAAGALTVAVRADDRMTYTLDEAARILMVSKRTVEELVRAGKKTTREASIPYIGSILIGRSRRIRRPEIEAYLEREQERQSREGEGVAS